MTMTTKQMMNETVTKTDVHDYKSIIILFSSYKKLVRQFHLLIENNYIFSKSLVQSDYFKKFFYGRFCTSHV
jgi:hypothetical protein